jgi:hypothetical protein
MQLHHLGRRHVGHLLARFQLHSPEHHLDSCSVRARLAKRLKQYQDLMRDEKQCQAMKNNVCYEQVVCVRN